jgi:hypothetical protein
MSNIMYNRKMNAEQVIERMKRIYQRLNNYSIEERCYFFELYPDEDEWEQIKDLIGTSGDLPECIRFSVYDEELAILLILTFME